MGKLQKSVLIDLLFSFFHRKSTPEYAELELSQSLVENFDVTYQFTLGKNGPSPLFINVDIWLPLEEYNGENIFTITEIEVRFYLTEILIKSLNKNCLGYSGKY